MTREKEVLFIVGVACLIHLIIGVLLITATRAGDSTGPHAVVSALGDETLAGAVMIASSALILGALSIAPLRRWWMLALAPQQFLLVLAAWGGIDAVLDKAYADGVARPAAFIFTDQLPMITFAVLHSTAVILLVLNDREKA